MKKWGTKKLTHIKNSAKKYKPSKLVNIKHMNIELFEYEANLSPSTDTKKTITTKKPIKDSSKKRQAQ